MKNSASPAASPALQRRGFFGKAAAFGTAAIGGAVAATSLTVGDVEEALAQGGSRVTLSDQMRLVQRHESDHVDFLLGQLGSAARMSPTFQNLESPNLASFLSLGRVLENVGVGAYLGAVPIIFNPATLAAAGTIALIEARHAGMFNSIQARAMTENVFGMEQSFETPLSIDDVVGAASVYIQDLNGPPLTFSTTPSVENDIDILNFALALEFLESAYYDLNVPRFFR